MQCILNHKQIEQKITRLAHQLIENCCNEKEIFIGGISGNGSILANKLLNIIVSNSDLQVHVFNVKINKSNPWNEKASVDIDENLLKDAYIILVDDVINSGKTMQYALLRLLNNPVKALNTVVLFDRQHRRYPVKANFVGLSLSTTMLDRVEVDFNKDNSKAFLV